MDRPQQGPLPDPVSGFIYPEAWVAACQDIRMLELAASGRGVLTASGKVLRRGYTTGTTAAAACKAAILSLKGPVREVRVRIPCGLSVSVPVQAEGGRAEASKFAGDYPADATAGIVFVAEARARDTGVFLQAGEGIGRFSRDFFGHRAGEPAISPSALQEIMDAVSDGMEVVGLGGVDLILSVPGGEAAAQKTLNPRLGILHGISVLGTTGLVEPWDDHLAESVRERVAAARRVVITTGRLGLRYARLHFPEHEAVLAGSRIRDALEAARGEVILCGLPGLVMKFLDPDILSGTGCVTVEELVARPEFREKVAKVFSSARKAYPGLRVVILSRNGEILGDSG
ncbi:MAG: cobalt-precorrin-5B (C(1))-methyltransferase [Methanolinea sp.]|nr:cobalt-precorrin-5B (C(1))-methyltransferase [Methanolinea sp.]